MTFSQGQQTTFQTGDLVEVAIVAKKLSASSANLLVIGPTGVSRGVSNARLVQEGADFWFVAG